MLLIFANSASAPEIASQLNGTVKARSVVWVLHSRDTRAAKLAAALAGDRRAVIACPEEWLPVSSIVAIALSCVITVAGHRSQVIDSAQMLQHGAVLFYAGVVLGFLSITMDCFRQN